MRVLAWPVFTLTPPPSPPTGGDLDPTSIGPGVVGFLATFAVVLVTVLLMLDMTRRVRRLRYRELLAQQAEQAEQDRGPGAARTDGAGPDEVGHGCGAPLAGRDRGGDDEGQENIPEERR